jgi:threonine aldolase
MNRFSFKNDYAEGCHANILKALVETNREQQIGYGGDQYSAMAKYD